MRIGITGGEGFIGSSLAKIIPDSKIFKGDLQNLKNVNKFITECDRVYHFAGLNRAEPGKILINNRWLTFSSII